MIAVTYSGLPPTETPPMHTDRIRTSLPVEIRIGRHVAEGTVRNASDGGMFVETRSIPPQGESVSLLVYPNSEARVEVTGLVWWTTEGSASRHRWRGFGLRLLEDDARYGELLARLRPASGATSRISASQRKTLAAASEAIRGSGRSPRSR